MEVFIVRCLSYPGQAPTTAREFPTMRTARTRAAALALALVGAGATVVLAPSAFG
jgi:hypothetical protein